jgi:F-type H+-transporting ATPase subunit gamma
MASLRDIRKRIKSVKNTEKITKAVKMVAAAKLRRAQDDVRLGRPYSASLDHVIARMKKRLDLQGEAPHPLLVDRQEKRKVELLVLTSDRGLCGAFNTNIARRAFRFYKDMQSQYQEVRVSTLGRKGHDFFRREGVAIHKNYPGILTDMSYLKAKEVAEELCKSYIDDDVDAVFLVYSEFKSAITQTVVIKPLLPVVPASLEPEESPVDYLYEPAQQILLEKLLARHFATKLYQSFVESLASEFGARMTAMDNATRNAKEMISRLTLSYNRVRQAAITKELMEIISGAEALR